MFQKATKSKAKLRAAIFGPSGSGKTFSSLRIATGLGGRIAVIDTERGSASKYADRFTFDICELDDKRIHGYIEAIEDADKGGYDILIIDSLSHAWQELLEEVDRLVNTKYRGNTWSAWAEGTPKQRKLVDSLLSFPGHVIATMRSKTEWATSQDSGKVRPQRVGLTPEQGKGIEYEFDLLLEISPTHDAEVIKDRTGKFQDKILKKPDEDFGKRLAAWLAEGEEPKPAHVEPTESSDQANPLQLSRIKNHYETLGYTKNKEMLDHTQELLGVSVDSHGHLTQEQADRLLELLEKEESTQGPNGHSSLQTA